MSNSAAPTAVNGISVHSLMFSPEGLVEITYSEDKDQSFLVQKMNVMRLDMERAPRVITQLVDDIVDIVEAALIHLSGDPDMIPGRPN